MIDESALITRLEGANTEELAHLILSCTVEEEKTLRIYLGNARFRRLRNLVLRREMVRDERREHGRLNVVFIPGVLGSQLTSIDQRQNRERVWLSPDHLVAGQMSRLRLAAGGLVDASSEYTIRVTGIMKRYYGEVMLALAEYHNAYAFWYDWRKDMRLSAAQLQARINNWFPAEEPVHLVAHASGGLVARAYIHQFSDWWDRGESKLIMIGTPNYGVYTMPQAFTGHLGLIQGIDLLDTQHDRTEFRDIVKSFPGLYQLLPAPLDPDLELLYQAETYGQELTVQQEHLESARGFHDMLADSLVDPARMIYIGGHNQPTFVDVTTSAIQDFEVTRTPDAGEELDYIKKTYELGLNGDGTVAHHMGVLRTAEGGYIPAYYVEALHGDLCSHPKVLLALQELLVGSAGPFGEDTIPSGLRKLTPDIIEDRRGPDVAERWKDSSIRASLDRDSEDRKTFETLVRRVNSRRDLSATRHLMTVEERDIEERLTYGFLSGEADRSQMTYRSIELSTPEIRIHAVSADITDSDLYLGDGAPPIDALAIGHYGGSKPHGILRTLDYKISRALQEEATSDHDENEYEDLSSIAAAEADDKNLLITQFTQRGTIRAELAQMFFLTDPHDASRSIAVAGMGEPGRFGAPELTVLVRELCWSLGRMGKKHLATALIGVGRDNLSVTEAVSSWVRGLKFAITGMAGGNNKDDAACVLEDITFFITDPKKMLIFDAVLAQETRRLAAEGRMTIRYTELTPEEREHYEGRTFDYVRKRMEHQLKERSATLPPGDIAPTRITVSVEGKAYHFGAITNSASIPEREIPLDPALIHRANDELAAETNPDRQLELGEFMQRLLFPADLRGLLSTNAPLVMMLDAKTARIHWELLAQSTIGGVLVDDLPQGEPRQRFLGTSRGFHAATAHDLCTAP